MIDIHPKPAILDMTTLDIIDTDTTRETVIGGTTVNVWVTRDGDLRCSTVRGDIVRHRRLPPEMHHLERAFEWCCQAVYEEEHARGTV